MANRVKKPVLDKVGDFWLLSVGRSFAEGRAMIFAVRSSRPHEGGIVLTLPEAEQIVKRMRELVKGR